MAVTLFCGSIFIGTYMAWYDLRNNGEMKRYMASFPFFLLLAAAVAKYLGL